MLIKVKDFTRLVWQKGPICNRYDYLSSLENRRLLYFWRPGRTWCGWCSLRSFRVRLLLVVAWKLYIGTNSFNTTANHLHLISWKVFKTHEPNVQGVGNWICRVTQYKCPIYTSRDQVYLKKHHYQTWALLAWLEQICITTLYHPVWISILSTISQVVNSEITGTRGTTTRELVYLRIHNFLFRILAHQGLYKSSSLAIVTFRERALGGNGLNLRMRFRSWTFGPLVDLWLILGQQGL
jgi:hypothetical protein